MKKKIKNIFEKNQILEKKKIVKMIFSFFKWNQNTFLL